MVFEKEGSCAIKCSFPKDYNDPYELFLGVDLNAPTDCLASYKEIVDEIPQFPTTCFSKSPIVSPMWAHYAREYTGFVLEFETDELEEHFQDCIIKEVSYQNEPDEDIEDLLLKVSRIGKPRHAHWLINATFNAAYFSKYTDWSYEQETRFVDTKGFSKSVNDTKILYIPLSCVTGFIAGSNFPTDNLNSSIKNCKEYGIQWYKLEIGKSYPVPYLKDDSTTVLVYKDGAIVEAEYMCISCSEPLVNEDEKCPWCKITDSHKLEAASINPFRMLDHFGLLEGYLEEVSKIGPKKK